MLDDNIYYIFELFVDPPELNFTALQEELRKSRNMWQGIEKKARVGNPFLKLTESPKPPGSLPNLANEAKIARLKELNTRIALDEADGILEQEEYDKTVKNFKKYFTEKTIKEHYKRKVYKFDVPPEPEEIAAGIKPTDRGMMKEIDGLLETLRTEVNEERKKSAKDVLEEKFGVTKEVKDIYDILKKRNVSSKSKFSDLQKAIDDATTVVSPIMSGRGSTLYKLFSKFKIIFADENSKRGYDLALKLKPFNTLVESEFLTIAGKYKGGEKISTGEYSLALERVKDKECYAAGWCVYDYFITQKKLKPPVEPIKDDRTQQCSVCSTYNKTDAELCTACGCPLKVKCPKCGRYGKFIDKICQCGFDFDEMRQAQDALKDAKDAINNCDINGAEKLMRKVNTFWRDCPGADEVRKSIEEEKKRFATVKLQINDLEKQVRTALGQRKLYEARSLFLELRRIPQANIYLVEEEKNVKKDLADVQTKFAQLPAITDIAKKIDVCEEIIAIAADCKEAQDALTKYPQLPPSNLSAKVNTVGSVDLTWTSPASRKQPMFVVVRKTGAAPVSPADGQTLIDNVNNTTFTDSTCETGVIYGYAVFTKRDKVCEQTGCRSQLVQRIGELAAIKVLPADSSVAFSWKKPANCISIQITRYQSGSTQGTKLPLQQETGITDSGLTNDTDYTYLFQCVFRTADGKTVETNGIKRTVKPQVPPSAVLDLIAVDGGDGVTAFQWTPPSRGEVMLFNLESVPDIPVGQTEADTPLELKKQHGEPLPILNPQQGQTRWNITTTGVRYIIPFTIHNGLATLGKSVSLVRIQNVTNLKAQISGPSLFVSWDWQKGQDKIWFVYRHDKQPEGVNDSCATKKTVTRLDYDREKAVKLSADSTQDFYIKVYSVVQHNGKEIYSAGVSTQTAVSEIHWKFIIRRKYYLFGTITDARILIERRSGKGIPDLVVRKDFDRKPLGRSFGTVAMEVTCSSERSVTVDFDVEQFVDNARFQVFTKNENEAGRYVLYGQSDETIQRMYQLTTFKEFILELLSHPVRSLMQIYIQIQQDFINKK